MPFVDMGIVMYGDPTWRMSQVKRKKAYVGTTKTLISTEDLLKLKINLDTGIYWKIYSLMIKSFYMCIQI